MKLTKESKEALKKEIKESLSSQKEVNKIVVFGSFVNTDNPNDIDIAVFQDSSEPYLSLAMKYRKLTRKISKKIPLDIIPIKTNVINNWFFSEIETGEMIYER
ncbi:nucleotidyltransferase domain-containing protein [Candidatus Poribacteria bacterium]|nr:nucleotidyltransferase domain-containing protein [Candidatus Poribacteria bacterium]